MALNGPPVGRPGLGSNVSSWLAPPASHSRMTCFFCLRTSPAAHACYTRRWVEYAYARTWTDQDRCVVNDLSARLGEDGYTIRDLLIDLTQTESFRTRALEATE